jgi:hypothetical protein
MIGHIIVDGGADPGRQTATDTHGMTRTMRLSRPAAARRGRATPGRRSRTASRPSCTSESLAYETHRIRVCVHLCSSVAFKMCRIMRHPGPPHRAENARRGPRAGAALRNPLPIQPRQTTSYPTATGIPTRSSTAFRSAAVKGFSRTGTSRRASPRSTDDLSPVMKTKLCARAGSFAISSR